MHAWPDNWQVSGADFMTNWVNCHIAASASLGKPMVLEEVQPAHPCYLQTHDIVRMAATLQAMCCHTTSVAHGCYSIAGCTADEWCRCSPQVLQACQIVHGVCSLARW